MYRSVFQMSLTGSALPNLGILPRVMIPSLLSKEAARALGAGKPGDFTSNPTQKEIFEETLYQGALMVPSMVLPGGVMRLMPSSMQATIRTPIGATTTRNLLGTAAFVAGSAGTEMAAQAIQGQDPFSGLSLSRSAFDAYIGHGIARQAAVRNAVKDLEKTPFPASTKPAPEGAPRIGGGSPTPETSASSHMDRLLRQHGRDALDDALTQVVLNRNPRARSPELLSAAAERLAARAAEASSSAATKLSGNPYKERTWSEVNQVITALEAELSGRSGLSLSRDIFREKSLLLKEARLAREAKLPEARFSNLASEARMGHRLEQVLSDSLDKPLPADTPQEIRATLEAIRRVRQSQAAPRVSHFVDGLKQTAKQGNIWGDLASLIINPHAPSTTPQQSADRAWQSIGELAARDLPGGASSGFQPHREHILSHYVRARANAQRTPELVAKYGGEEAYLARIDQAATLFNLYVARRAPSAEISVHDLFSEFVINRGVVADQGSLPNRPTPRLR
jgi:hypothetical protein